MMKRGTLNIFMTGTGHSSYERTIMDTYTPLGVGDQVFKGYQGNWVKVDDLSRELSTLLLLLNGEENPKETLRNRITSLRHTIITSKGK